MLTDAQIFHRNYIHKHGPYILLLVLIQKECLYQDWLKHSNHKDTDFERSWFSLMLERNHSI